nr:carbon-nitrogen hydrolase family protein [Sedimentibacter sp.]
MKRKIKVALGQFASTQGDVLYNVTKAEKFIYKAADIGADIICLPELFATGCSLDSLGDSIMKLSIENYSLIYERMSRAAGDNYINLIAPFAMVDEHKNIKNAAFLFSRSGELLEAYGKTHILGAERKYFTEGNALNAVKTDIGKIGMLISTDAYFPEAARTLCRKGADIIFVPSAIKAGDGNAWSLTISSRALENSLFVLGINGSGTEGDYKSAGRSMACSPEGEVILQMNSDADELFLCEIDLKKIEEARGEDCFINNLRPEIYQ